MLINEAINSLLIGDTTLRELLEITDSSPATYRVFPGVIPGDIDVTDPTICYRAMDDGLPVINLDPNGNGHSGLAHSTFAIFSTARDYDSAKELDDAVRLCLHGYQGSVDSVDGDDELYIQGLFVRGARDFHDDRTKTHQAIRLIDVWFSQERVMRQDSFTPVVRNGDTGAVITNTPGVEGYYQYRPGESVKIWLGGELTLGDEMEHVIFELPSGLWTPRTASGPPSADGNYPGSGTFEHSVDGSDVAAVLVDPVTAPTYLRFYTSTLEQGFFSAGTLGAHAFIEFPIL